MKCDDCAFLKNKIELDGLLTFYACKLAGVDPDPDCKYFKKKTDKEQEEKL